MNENLNFNQGNINYEPDNLNSSTKIKLDEILDSLKNIKHRNNLIDELKSAIKILKRFKMAESAKW
jgi:hypothetical protein